MSENARRAVAIVGVVAAVVIAHPMAVLTGWAVSLAVIFSGMVLSYRWLFVLEDCDGVAIEELPDNVISLDDTRRRAVEDGPSKPAA